MMQSIFSQFRSLKRMISDSTDSQDPLITILTRGLFKTTAYAYIIWMIIAFYIRPFGITLMDLLFHYTFVFSLVITGFIYFIAKIVLNNPDIPGFTVRSVIKPVLAGSSLIITIVFITVFINQLPEYIQNKGPSDIQSEDALSVAANPTEAPIQNTNTTPTEKPIENTTNAAATPTPAPAETKPTVDKDNARIMIQQLNPATQEQNTIVAYYKIVNTGKVEVDLSLVKIRYYFNSKSSNNLAFSPIEVPRGIDKVSGSFVASKAENEHYLELSFKDSFGVLTPNHYTEVKFKISGLDRGSYRQDTDFSFNPENKYVYSRWTPVYLGDTLSWGQNPPKKLLR